MKAGFASNILPSSDAVTISSLFFVTTVKLGFKALSFYFFKLSKKPFIAGSSLQKSVRWFEILKIERICCLWQVKRPSFSEYCNQGGLEWNYIEQRIIDYWTGRNFPVCKICARNCPVALGIFLRRTKIPRALPVTQRTRKLTFTIKIWSNYFGIAFISLKLAKWTLLNWVSRYNGS